MYIRVRAGTRTHIIYLYTLKKIIHTRTQCTLIQLYLHTRIHTHARALVFCRESNNKINKSINVPTYEKKISSLKRRIAIASVINNIFFPQ